jgi:hypothetical protein
MCQQSFTAKTEQRIQSLGNPGGLSCARNPEIRKWFHERQDRSLGEIKINIPNSPFTKPKYPSSRIYDASAEISVYKTTGEERYQERKCELFFGLQYI